MFKKVIYILFMFFMMQASAAILCPSANEIHHAVLFDYIKNLGYWGFTLGNNSVIVDGVFSESAALALLQNTTHPLKKHATNMGEPFYYCLYAPDGGNFPQYGSPPTVAWKEGAL